jgi:Insertion element 4 transposase N-terminal/Transposase DDE domain
MARTTATLSGGRRLSDYVTLGVLSLTVPTALVDEVLAETGRQSRRYRQLPARLVVYYVMALALFAQASSGEVLRCLLEGVRWLRWRGEGVRLASKAALTKARVRLGPAPLRLLYGRIARPLAPATVPGAWYRGRRLVSLDGTTLEVPDTPDLEARFGRPKASRGTSSFPQLRLLGLLEIGTRALFRVVFDRYDVGEVTLAERILDQLQAGMLCLADRGFVGFALWQAASATGADLLWRVRRNQRLPCWQRLPDGSYLSRLYASAKDRRQDRNGLVVRVIEYRLTGVPKAEPLYRLITTLLDPVAAPAAELAALYHERWEAETAFAELKVSLPGERLMLRSRRVDLIEQELYGLLLVHFALRRLMVEASQQTAGDPDTLSFLHTVQVVRRHLPFHAAFSPSAPSADDRPDPAGDPGRARRAASTARQPPGGQAQDEQLPDQGPRQGRAPDTVADRRRVAH